MRGKKTNKITGIWCFGFMGVALCLILLFGICMPGCTEETYTQSPDMLGPLWVSCVTDGFNHPEEQSGYIARMASFKGYLYLGKSEAWTGHGDNPAKMYRIHRGDPCSEWEAVVGDGAAMPEGFDANFWQYTGMIVFKDALYVIIDTEIWRTYDGINWQPIIARGGVLPPGFGIGAYYMADPQVFKDMLYVCALGLGSATIWRTNDGITWEPVVGAGSSTPDSFGEKFGNGKICVFNDHLYTIIDNGDYTNPVYRTDDGVHWEKICDNIGSDGMVWRQPVVFKGYIYVPTRNGSNWKIHRSSDGKTWETIIPPGCPYHTINKLLVWDDYLFLGMEDDDNGCRILRTTDGKSWTIIAETGFYEKYLKERNSRIGDMAVFDGQVFVGTASFRGYQCELWRSNFPTSPVHASLIIWKPAVCTFIVLVISISLWKFKSKLGS